MAEHNRLGNWGEQVVVDHLVAEGYAIVKRNWRMNHLEIDIIATKGKYVAFVEVKTRRTDDANPFEAVTRRKINHMVAAANVYLRMERLLLEPRFDVAAVTGDPHDYKLEYVADAFRPPLRTYR